MYTLILFTAFYWFLQTAIILCIYRKRENSEFNLSQHDHDVTQEWFISTSTGINF